MCVDILVPITIQIIFRSDSLATLCRQGDGKLDHVGSLGVAQLGVVALVRIDLPRQPRTGFDSLQRQEPLWFGDRGRGMPTAL